MTKQQQLYLIIIMYAYPNQFITIFINSQYFTFNYILHGSLLWALKII